MGGPLAIFCSAPGAGRYYVCFCMAVAGDAVEAAQLAKALAESASAARGPASQRRRVTFAATSEVRSCDDGSTSLLIEPVAPTATADYHTGRRCPARRDQSGERVLVPKASVTASTKASAKRGLSSKERRQRKRLAIDRPPPAPRGGVGLCPSPRAPIGHSAQLPQELPSAALCEVVMSGAFGSQRELLVGAGATVVDDYDPHVCTHLLTDEPDSTEAHEARSLGVQVVGSAWVQQHAGPSTFESRIVPFVWSRDLALARPTNAHTRGEFASCMQLARFFWTRVARGWRIDDTVMTVPLLELNLSVARARGQLQGEYRVGRLGPRLGSVGWEWDAPHLEGALMPIRSYFNLASRPIAKWPRPPPCFDGELQLLPRSGAAVTLLVNRSTICPLCEGEVPWVTLSIRAFSVERHELFSGEYDDKWESATDWDWNGLPVGRAERMDAREERLAAAARRHALDTDADIDADLVDDWQGYNEWIDQVDDEWV